MDLLMELGQYTPWNEQEARDREELCRRLSIPIADAVAAGDEANDISMLRAAGVGAAMCNGIQAAKEAADYVTQRDNNHDGIEEVIRKFML